MGTTGVVAKVINNGLEREIVHGQAGDSRLYVVRENGSAKLLTFDEGVVFVALKSGKITLEQANEIQRKMDAAETAEHITGIEGYWRRRNEIDNFLGSHAFSENDTRGKPTIRRDPINERGGNKDIALLLVTDGITDSLSSAIFDEIIRKHIDKYQPLKDLPKVLVDRADLFAHYRYNFRRKPDDMTAVVMGITK